MQPRTGSSAIEHGRGGDRGSWAMVILWTVLYMAPALVACILPAWLNWQRREQILDIVTDELKAKCPSESKGSKDSGKVDASRLAQQLADFRIKKCECQRDLKKAATKKLALDKDGAAKKAALDKDVAAKKAALDEEATWRACLPKDLRDSQPDSTQELDLRPPLRQKLREHWRIDVGLWGAMTVLPSLLVAVSLGRRSRSDAWRAVSSDLVSKVMLWSCVAWGWLYFYNPYGQGATAYSSLLSALFVSGEHTLPLWFDLSKSPSKHTALAFVGLYIHILGLFWLKALKGDVVSTRIYALLFRKYLIVTGAAIAIGAVATDEAAIIAFLVGLSPFSALSVLRRVSARGLDPAVEQEASLSMLPAISRDQIDRLEEEGIDSMSALAGADTTVLSQLIPPAIVRREQLVFWRDIARLVSVIGIVRYSKISESCLTATAFLERCQADDLEAIRKTGTVDPKEVKDHLVHIYPDLHSAPPAAPEKRLTDPESG